MHEVDMILKGKRRQEQLLRETQNYRLAHATKPSQAAHDKEKAIAPVRAVLIALINLVTR